jgi:hypothetical protein
MVCHNLYIIELLLHRTCCRRTKTHSIVELYEIHYYNTPETSFDPGYMEISGDFWHEVIAGTLRYGVGTVQHSAKV